jgi:hypothetical protein
MESGRVFDSKHHQDAIRRLADSLGTPLETVQSLYERELERITPEARIKDYLAVLISRRVKDQLIHQA